VAPIGVVCAGAILPFTPAASTLGFRPLPGVFFAVLVLMVVCYLGHIEVGKRWFYHETAAQGHRRCDLTDLIQRRSARFSTAHAVPARASRANGKAAGRPKVPQMGA
jgi:Mg2+-importing ATPase